MKKALLIIGIINLLRLLLIPFINKLPFEWIQNILIFDNESSQLTAIQYLFASFGISESKTTLQLLSFLVSLLIQWSLVVIISKIIRSSRKAFAWIAISSSLLISLFSVLPFADVVIGLFWVLSLLTFYNAIFEYNKKQWVFSGLFMGATCLIKLSGIALPVGLLVFLIFSSRYRNHLYTPGPYLSLLIAAIVSAPVWFGLVKPESATLTIDFANGFLTSFGRSFNSFTSFILFQFLLVFPVLYLGLWWVSFKYLARIFNKPNQVNAEFWFLLSFFLPLFLGFHLIALFDWVDMMGLAPIYLTGLIVFLKLSKNRWFVVNLVLSFVFHAFFILSLVFV